MTTTTPRTCCTRADATGWLEVIAAGALGGDVDMLRLLPAAVQHFLDVEAGRHLAGGRTQ